MNQSKSVSNMSDMQTTHGFTLVELLIAVAIIAILAAIAIPSYQSYTLRSNRAEVKALLVEVASKQEAFYADRRTYATALTQLGYAASECKVGGSNNGCGTSATGLTYVVSLSNAAATTYTLSAAPQNAQTKDTGCGTLSINQTGEKAATGSDSDCW